MSLSVGHFKTFIKLSRCYSVSPKGLPVLTLYTKDPCQLCDIAKEEISTFGDRFKLKIVDITKRDNSEWWTKYKYDIPVFHFEGKFLMQHRADLNLLEDALLTYEKRNDLH